MNLRTILVGTAAVVAALGLGTSRVARADLPTYTIDPNLSSLTISGNLTVNFASQQTAGSLTTKFTGTIKANRTATTIQFPGGSVLDAALQSVNQQPRADATPGSAPADYGRTAPGPFSTTALEALRGLILDVEDDTSGAGITLSGSNFASNSLVLVVSQGNSDVIFGNGSAEVDLSGKATSNSSNNGASSVSGGSNETLTLKFSSGAISYGVSHSGDSSISFTGTIVATAVPEPVSAVMVSGLAAATLLRRRRMRV
jgi:hypothetical protein